MKKKFTGKIIAIMGFCDKCGKEYKNVVEMYGKKCECGNDLHLAEKRATKRLFCILDLEINISERA